MAWSHTSSASYIEDPLQFFENFTISRVKDSQGGYMRYLVQGSVSIYNGGNYYVGSKSIVIRVGSARYYSETQTTAFYGSGSYSVYVQVPNSAAGQAASIQGAICTSNTFTLDTALVMTLSISPATVTAGNNVGLTVANGSGTALTAIFKYGSITLATQSFSTGALNCNCPPAWFDTAGVTALSSMTVSVTITGGPNEMTGSFTLQAGSSMKPVMGAAAAVPVQSENTAAFPDTYIANYSRAKVSVAVSAPTNAAITKVVLSYPGGTGVTAAYNSASGKYEATTEAPLMADTVLTMTATDQRGLQSSTSVTVTGVVAYTPPSVAIDTAYRCDANGYRNSGGAYYRIKVTATWYTALEGNSLKKLTAGVKNGTGSTIASGTVCTLAGLSDPKKSYTIVVIVQDQISDEVRKEITLEGMLRNLVITRSDEGTHLGIGTTPEGTEEKSTVELPNGGKYLTGGHPVQSLMQPIDSTDGSSFEKNLLNINTTQRDTLVHRTAFFHKDAAGTGWSNMPPIYTAQEWYGLREVLWMDANHILVRVTDLSGQGYVWLNRWEQGHWSGWYALDMTLRNN